MRALTAAALLAGTRAAGVQPAVTLAAGGPLHGWSRSDLLALAGIVVTVILAAIPPLRRAVVTGWRLALLRAGLPRRRYARWFTAAWGTYENPYLDDTESLDLSNTYVPLSLRAGPEDRERLTVALDVLADPAAGSLIIEGAPGSGKSTLLRAYGVGVARTERGLRRQDRTVPFLVQLRKLARYGNGPISIADYITAEILGSGAGMKPDPARRFFQHALASGRVLVMLDGLDEVTADRYPAVLEAVYRFCNSHRPECPSHRARLVVTCRRQNFLSLRDEWVPAIAATVCALAPLRDSEIFSYLDKLRPKFRATGGPESFLAAVRASGTLDLHRVPLILAMSVGLYARKDYFEIPSSIARLYQAMIEEMLDRHRFKGDPGGAAVAFHLGDKYRFLREFALHSARQEGFDEFSRDDLMKLARELAPDLDAVADPVAFVMEVLQRSGLLTDVGDGRRYVFAHRSIHEFLAAVELRLSDGGEFLDGGAFLLARAADPEWRQVIQFYAAGLEQRQANAFLPALSVRNQELAGYCLAVAKTSDDAAATVLDTLQPVDGARLSALAAATMSPRIPVQHLAITRLVTELSRPDSPLAALSGEIDALLPLLRSLAGTNAAHIAALIPQVIAQVPDDPRLVGPLWQCLVAPGIESLPAARVIVTRLLDLACAPDGFAELARQDPYTRRFLTPEARRRAYPFSRALPPDHNLITLLTWADYLALTPADPNRYFQARLAGRLDRVETDRRRAISFAPFLPARISTSVFTSAIIIAAIAVTAADPHRLVRPFGAWTLGLMALLATVPLGVHVGLTYVTDAMPGKVRFFLGEKGRARDSGNIMDFALAGHIPNWAHDVIYVVIMPLAIPVALAPLMGESLSLYVVVTVMAGLAFWIPSVDFFDRSRRYYLYKPNPYIDMYEDSCSRHWLAGGLEPGVVARPSVSAPAPQPTRGQP